MTKNTSVRQPLLMNGCSFLFVIPSVLGFPTSPLSIATTDVVLPKENHMQLTEAATLDRKSGEAEGSAVPRTFLGNAFLDSALRTIVVRPAVEPKRSAAEGSALA